MGFVRLHNRINTPSHTPAHPRLLQHIPAYHTTDLYIAENACCNDYADTWSLKLVQILLKCQCPNRGTSEYGGEDTLQLYTTVAWARLPITGIHPQVAAKSKTQWLQATLHNRRWMDHCELCYGRIEAITISQPVNVEEAYSHIASRYHSVQWLVG
jgi:hypothetical protein